MLPAHQRLMRPAEFLSTVRQGQRVGRRHVVVHLRIPTPASLTGGTWRPEFSRSGSSARMGLVVSKAVGNAVSRHRVSRQLRAIMFELLPRLPPDVVVVLRALPPAAAASGADLNADITGALRRLGVLDRRP